MRYKLDSSYHAVFSLHYHLVIVTKYRRPVLDNLEVQNRLKAIFKSLEEKIYIEIISMESNVDHTHVLFKESPKTNLIGVVKYLKGVSARYIRKEFPETAKLLWKECLWSRSYFLATSGDVSLDILKSYVEKQGGERHRDNSEN